MAARSVAGSRSHRPLVVLAVALLGGCADRLPGTYYAVTLETARDVEGRLKDDCRTPPAALRFDLTYRLVQSGPDVQIFVDDALFASGRLDGCRLTYQSNTWSEERPGGRVRWAAAGVAQVGFGSSCAQGWDGVETLQVFESEDPEVRAGCTAEFDVTGTLEDRVE